jgi:hypothetical protein
MRVLVRAPACVRLVPTESGGPAAALAVRACVRNARGGVTRQPARGNGPCARRAQAGAAGSTRAAARPRARAVGGPRLRHQRSAERPTGRRWLRRPVSPRAALGRAARTETRARRRRRRQRSRVQAGTHVRALVNRFSNDRCAAQRQRRSAEPRLNGVAATREEARGAAGKWQGRGRPLRERGTTVPPRGTHARQRVVARTGGYRLPVIIVPVSMLTNKQNNPQEVECLPGLPPSVSNVRAAARAAGQCRHAAGQYYSPRPWWSCVLTRARAAARRARARPRCANIAARRRTTSRARPAGRQSRLYFPDASGEAGPGSTCAAVQAHEATAAVPLAAAVLIVRRR